MKYDIVELEEFSGSECKVYSLMKDGCEETMYDEFLAKYRESNFAEIEDINFRLYAIGNKVGACENFFKMNEGKLGDGVCALYDIPNSNLRLYCIRYGGVTLVVGGGGAKRKSVRRWQDSPELKSAVLLLMQASSKITESMKEKELILDENGFSGNMTINLDDYGK